MKNFRLTLSAHWQTFGAMIGAFIVLGYMLTFRLGALTRQHLSRAELASHTNGSSLHVILHNPINGPYKLLDFVFLQINIHSAAFARLSSVVFALVACTLFGIIMYRWHGRRTALFATTLFGTSSWLLHVGRLGTGDATLLLIPLALILFASWLNTTDRHGPALLYMTIASGLALFTPGATWFLIAAYVLIWRAIAKHIVRARLWEKSLSIVVLLYFVILLFYTLFHSPQLYKVWLDLPPVWPAPLTMLKQWLDSVVFLFVRGPSNPSLWLAHVPILDIFTALMSLIGAYFYATHYKNLRSHVLFAFLILGSLLVALNGATGMNYIVPVVYLLAGTGLTYFLRQWLTVFPRNPLARGLGIGLISLVVCAAALYHVRSYFVAWAYSPETTVVFREQP